MCNAAFHLVSSVSGSEECCRVRREVAPVGDSTTLVMERLDFSQCIVNPNKFNFYKEMWIAIVIIFCLTFLHSLSQFLSRIWWLSFSSSAPCLSAFQWKTPVIAKVVMTAYVLVSRLYDWIPPMSRTFR